MDDAADCRGDLIVLRGRLLPVARQWFVAYSHALVAR